MRQHLGRRVAAGEMHAREHGGDQRRVEDAEFRQGGEAPFDLAPRIGFECLRGLLTARLGVDQPDFMAGIGEGVGDAAPHAPGAERGKPR